MKKLVATIIEKIEQNHEYIPFHLVEPIRPVSKK